MILADSLADARRDLAAVLAGTDMTGYPEPRRVVVPPAVVVRHGTPWLQPAVSQGPVMMFGRLSLQVLVAARAADTPGALDELERWVTAVLARVPAEWEITEPARSASPDDVVNFESVFTGAVFTLSSVFKEVA